MTARFIKHNLIPYMFSKTPLAQLYKAINVHLIIPYYHMINDYEVLHIKHLYKHKTIKEFSLDIEYLSKSFHLIHLNDLLDFLKNGHRLPDKALLLTFDDGFREMHDIVSPILLQKGIPATFFINSDFTDNHNLCFQHKASLIVEHLSQYKISKAVQKKIEKLLGQDKLKETSINSSILAIKYDERNLVDQIAETLAIDFNNYLEKYQPYLTTPQIHRLISDGFTIGGHSIDHPFYADLTLKEQVRQTMESVRMVRDTFNLAYGAFAFPHSDNGISKQYFNQIQEKGLVDVSFGTSGIIKDCVSHHFQRFSMEKPMRPAKDILAYQYAKTIWRIINHDGTIRRTAF